jgi:hypothetical protein
MDHRIMKIIIEFSVSDKEGASFSRHEESCSVAIILCCNVQIEKWLPYMLGCLSFVLSRSLGVRQGSELP